MPQAAPDVSIAFPGRSFCFTGTMADLKRTQAEREARARGGLTCNVVNHELDFLVVGSIASIGWKHGSYGRKIEAARALTAERRSRLRIVSEAAFMEALALTPVQGAGEIDRKLVVATYKFLTPDEDSYDAEAMAAALANLQQEHGAHVAIRTASAFVHMDLFDEDPHPGAETQAMSLIVECRLILEMPLAATPTAFLAAIEAAFEPIRGVDGTLHWFEKTEGCADYIRLVREIPQRVRAPTP